MISKDAVEILKAEGIGVIPTDTLYGLVGQALSKKTVEKMYTLKGRNIKKPFIILLSSINDLKLFNIKLDSETKSVLKEIWPGKVSVILPCSSKKFSYLHRGKNTLAFRIPKKPSLRKLLEKTGPLVAPSANREGLKPAATIKEAKAYFGDKVDFYLSEGKKESSPSTLIEIKKGKIIIKRKGDWR